MAPHVLTLCLCLAILWGGVSLTKRLGSTLRYSIYYDSKGDVEAKTRAQHQREQEASEWARGIASGALQWPQPRPRPRSGSALCIAVLTAPRAQKPSPYVAHTVKSVYASMTREEGGRVFSVAVIRGENPLPEVFAHFDAVVAAKDVPAGGFGNLRKESADYVLALEACNAAGSEFVLVLQDDAWATHQVTRKIQAAIQHTDQTYRHWFFVKLFYHEFWDGWATETCHLLVLFAVLVFVISFGVVVRMCSPLHRHKHHVLLHALLIAATLTTLAAWMPYALGRQHVVPAFYPGLNRNRGSAAVAILFNNRDGDVARLSHFLRDRITSDVPIDLLIDDFLSHAGKSGFIWAPSLFQHTGMRSSIAHKSSAISASRLRVFKESMTFRER